MTWREERKWEKDAFIHFSIDSKNKRNNKQQKNEP